MLSIPYQRHTLLGVPAIHGRAVFAEMVNRACADESRRPDAIAVELEPNAVAAVVSWLRELGVGQGRGPLPCMLGLTCPNRWLHPRVREAAFRLQAETGQPLHELPPERLHRELGYAPLSLLCLSPTDSIIEALRCAIELEIPAYGIDLDHARPGEREGLLALRDSVVARTDLAGYIERHRRQIEPTRDDYLDGRREQVMAARLKALLCQHERVLFTGGLAHWPPILTHLADAALAPAVNVPQSGANDYRRVLVEPQEALRRMDVFPAITAAYEAARQPASSRASRPDVDFPGELERCLTTAASRYAQPPEAATPPRALTPGLLHFTPLLQQVALLSQQLTPNLCTLLRVARSVAPAEFVQVLTDTLMDFPWASPAAFPELPVIGPPPDGAAGQMVLKVPHRRTFHKTPNYRGSTVPVTAHQDAANVGTPDLTWEWADQPDSSAEAEERYGYNFVWPPCEHLFYAGIYQAINMADTLARATQSEPLRDSMEQGLDLKATLRATLHGKPQLFVRRPLATPPGPPAEAPRQPVYTAKLELQPTVFLFSRPEAAEDGDWECLMAGDTTLYNELSPAGQAAFDRQFEHSKGCFVESLHFTEEQPIPAHLHPWVNSFRRTHGAVRFGNPCSNFHQAARWLEKGGFKVAPFVPGKLNIHSARRHYRDQHQLTIDLNDWQNALILFALPYAVTERRVVVVAPSGFRPSRGVQREARRRRVALVGLPLASFPPKQLAAMQEQYSVKASQGGKAFPRELERLFGHGPHHYQALLPRPIARQTRPGFDTRPARPRNA